MKKYKIFYIFGYGENPECENIQLLKKKVNKKKYEIISDYYAQYSPKEAKYDIENYIKKLDIDLIIGENIGGYIGMILDNKIPKVVINPILNPVKELEKIEGTQLDENGNEVKVKLVPEHILNFYKEGDYKLNYDNVFCLVTDMIEYNKCKDQKFINIINTDNIADTISEALNKVKEGN